MASKKPPPRRPPAKSSGKPRRPSARVAAAARARQRRDRQRWIITVSALALVLAIVAVLIGPILGGGDDDNSSDSTTTTNPAATTAAVSSVKGKPCVKVAGPLPKGAPEVPVKTGPPPTALVKKDLKVGDGAVVAPASQLTVDYIGVSCSTGKIFDSSYSRGEPASFGLDGVIPGWSQGIPGMKVGGTRLLGIPSELAYGAAGRPPDIAPDEALWFVVHIVSAK